MSPYVSRVRRSRSKNCQPCIFHSYLTGVTELSAGITAIAHVDHSVHPQPGAGQERNISLC